MKDFFKLRNEEKGAGEFGTDELRKKYQKDTPGEMKEKTKFTDKQIKMAYGILNDPRYKGGNMTAAVKKIEQIAKGLSKHPGVQKALRVTNEAVELDEKYSWNDVNDALTKANYMRGNPAHINRVAAKFNYKSGKDKNFSLADVKKNLAAAGIDGAKQHDVMKHMKESVELEEARNRYSPLQMAKAKKEREDRRKREGDDGDRVKRLNKKVYGKMMGGLRKESVELEEGINQKKFTDGAKAMKAYAMKNGGIDKADFMKVAKSLETISRINILQAGQELARLNRMVDGLDTDVRERIYAELKKVGLIESTQGPDPIILEELKVSDGVAKWITDFKDSDAPQFQGKSDEERKKMAIAAFLSAKEKEGGGEDKKKEEGYKSYAQQKAVWAARKDGGKGHPDNKKKKNESVNESNWEEISMMMNQLDYIQAAAEDIKEYVKTVDDTEEWFQNKISSIHS